MNTWQVDRRCVYYFSSEVKSLNEKAATNVLVGTPLLRLPNLLLYILLCNNYYANVQRTSANC